LLINISYIDDFEDFFARSVSEPQKQNGK